MTKEIALTLNVHMDIPGIRRTACVDSQHFVRLLEAVGFTVQGLMKQFVEAKASDQPFHESRVATNVMTVALSASDCGPGYTPADVTAIYADFGQLRELGILEALQLWSSSKPIALLVDLGSRYAARKPAA
jgi:hypothetical protein